MSRCIQVQYLLSVDLKDMLTRAEGVRHCAGEDGAVSRKVKHVVHPLSSSIFLLIKRTTLSYGISRYLMAFSHSYVEKRANRIWKETR
jgi:hypothetical protein